MREPKIYLRIVVNFLLTILGIVLAIVFIPKLLRFFLPFVIAFIISSIANPVVRFMEKRIKIVRKHGTAIIIVVVLAAVIGVLYLLVSFLAKEIVGLAEDMPSIVNQLLAFVENISARLESLYALLPAELGEKASSLEEAIRGAVTGFLSDFKMPSLSTAGGYVRNIADILLISIVTLMASYFFTADRDKIAATVKKIVPASIVEYYNLLAENVKSAVGGYFKAQFKIMLVITAILFIGLELLKINYSFLLALLIAFLDLLPVFGTGTVLWPWIIIDIIAGNYKQAAFLGVMYLVCQLVKQLLQPKMVGDSVGISPFATLFFMFVGYRLGGVFGMIVGIPIGMALINFYRLGLFDRLIRGIKIIASDINEFRKY